MNRFVLAPLFVALSTTAVWAQAEQPALSESYFLNAAGESVSRGDFDAAAQLFQSAIIYAPNDPIPYHRLGQLYAQSGQPELAQQYFNLALNVEPAYAPALEGLALLDLAAGNRAGAEAQRDILLRACGATCPETAQVQKALNADRQAPINR